MPERFECIAPKLVEPSPQFPETFWVYVIDAARALRAIDHQSGFFQCFEVLRNGWATDRQALGENTHRLGAGTKFLEHPAASGVAQALQCLSVRHGLR